MRIVFLFRMQCFIIHSIINQGFLGKLKVATYWLHLSGLSKANAKKNMQEKKFFVLTLTEFCCNVPIILMWSIFSHYWLRNVKSDFCTLGEWVPAIPGQCGSQGDIKCICLNFKFFFLTEIHQELRIEVVVLSCWKRLHMHIILR